MLEQLVQEYGAFLKLDVTNGFQTVQDVIDNMLTRLEELTSVLQMIKVKNSDCQSAVSDDIIKYRIEINNLSKKIITLNEVILRLYTNIELLEKQVDKAEADFGVNSDSKLKSILMPFLKRNKETVLSNNVIVPPVKLTLPSVLDSFEEHES